MIRPVLALSCLALGSLAVAEEPPAVAIRAPRADVITAETPWFLIHGESSAETGFVARLARQVGAALERAGFHTGAIANSRVTVYINNAEPASSLNTADHRTALILPLNKYADARHVAKTLAEAALTRLAQAAERRAAPARHATEALAWEAVAPVRPGTAEYLAIRSRELGPMSLERLAAGDAPENDDHFSVSAFWLHRAMRETATDPRVPLAEAAMGAPLDATLKRISPTYAAGGDAAAAWWPAAHYRLTTLRTPAVETPEDSRLRLAGLARIIIQVDGADRPASNDDVIARRQDPAMREELRARLLQIKTGLPGTNPVWQNAFIARGAFFEALLEENPQRLTALAAEAEKEAGDAFVLAGEISAALQPSPRPNVAQ